MIEIVFWTLAGLLIYSIVGYPLLVFLLGGLLRRKIDRGETLPDVQLIVPVHNAEAELEAKLQNCLELDYPAGRLRIRVVSDGSTDGTVAIAERFADRGVETVVVSERVGKVAAQNKALEGVTAPVVLFTDIGIRVGPAALRHVASNFADPDVGVVSCRDAVDSSGGEDAGESLYIRYDMALRAYSNRSGTLIGATGGFYAARRQLVEGGWNPAHPPDFYAALAAIRHGMRVVEDERVVATYTAVSDRSSELERKVRTMTRGMRALADNADLLNPFRYGLAALKLLHHKLLRWSMPLLLAGMLVVAGLIVSIRPDSLFWIVVLALQIAGYAAGLLGLTPLGDLPGLKQLTRAPAFVVLANLALARSWWNVLNGQDYTAWTPTARGSGS
jgi:cellulose synthase/poly-beta-1,6-N-acetylglucosamine synthase-like glycosyltransferase